MEYLIMLMGTIIFLIAWKFFPIIDFLVNTFTTPRDPHDWSGFPEMQHILEGLGVTTKDDDDDLPR